jgi:hypothetical protein
VLLEKLADPFSNWNDSHIEGVGSLKTLTKSQNNNNNYGELIN